MKPFENDIQEINEMYVQIVDNDNETEIMSVLFDKDESIIPIMEAITAAKRKEIQDRTRQTGFRTTPEGSVPLRAI